MEIMTSLTSEFFLESTSYTPTSIRFIVRRHRREVRTQFSRSRWMMFALRYHWLVWLYITGWLSSLSVLQAQLRSQFQSVDWINQRTRASEGNVTRKNQKIRREEFTLLMRYLADCSREKKSRNIKTHCADMWAREKRRKRTQTLMTHESEFFNDLAFFPLCFLVFVALFCCVDHQISSKTHNIHHSLTFFCSPPKLLNENETTQWWERTLKRNRNMCESFHHFNRQKTSFLNFSCSTAHINTP